MWTVCSRRTRFLRGSPYPATSTTSRPGSWRRSFPRAGAGMTSRTAGLRPMADTDGATRAMLETPYEHFNARDIAAILPFLSTDVEWPNGWEGGYVRGHAAVRDYWTRQWREIDSTVVPTDYTTREDGRICVTVRQV